MKEFLKQLFTDVNGKFSGKRFFGFLLILSGVGLAVWVVVTSTINGNSIDPQAVNLVIWVVGFGSGLAGVSVVEKKVG